jgi:hypothetical protein
MNIYDLSNVDSTIDGVLGQLRYGFNIVGGHGRPLVSFSFESRDEADDARKAMQAIIASAKGIKPFPS